MPMAGDWRVLWRTLPAPEERPPETGSGESRGKEPSVPRDYPTEMPPTTANPSTAHRTSIGPPAHPH